MVHYRALVFLYTSPTGVVLCYPKPVLYPPSFWLISYPVMIRAPGHHALQRPIMVASIVRPLLQLFQ